MLIHITKANLPPLAWLQLIRSGRICHSYPGKSKLSIDDWDGNMGIVEIEIFANSNDVLQEMKNIELYGKVGPGLGFNTRLLGLQPGALINLASKSHL